MSIGKIIQEQRISHKLTQKKLAELIGVHVTVISHYENERSIPPTKTLISLANALDIPMELLFSRPDETVTDNDRHSLTVSSYSPKMFNRDLIREGRARKKMSQKSLAEKLKVDHSVVTKYENGVIIPPTEKLESICMILDIPIRDFFQENVENDHRELSTEFQNLDNHPEMLQWLWAHGNPFNAMKLTKERKKQHLTQKELAQKLHVSPAMMSRYESGRAIPTIEKAEQIASLLDLNLVDLINPDSIDQFCTFIKKEH